MVDVGLKSLVKYLLCKFCVAVHLLHSTVKRYHCGVWLKTTTLWVLQAAYSTHLLWIVWV